MKKNTSGETTTDDFNEVKNNSLTEVNENRETNENIDTGSMSI